MPSRCLWRVEIDVSAREFLWVGFTSILGIGRNSSTFDADFHLGRVTRQTPSNGRERVPRQRVNPSRPGAGSRAQTVSPVLPSQLYIAVLFCLRVSECFSTFLQEGEFPLFFEFRPSASCRQREQRSTISDPRFASVLPPSA
jgi:hypothetical protein